MLQIFCRIRGASLKIGILLQLSLKLPDNGAVKALLLAALLLPGLCPAETVFRLRGRIEPASHAAVSIHGSTTQFSASTFSDSRGRFEFKKLTAGTYTLSLFFRARGELRRTIEVGPGTADAKGMVEVSFTVKEDFLVQEEARRRQLAPVSELSIPDKARKLYGEAQKRLEKRDTTGAVAKLEEAVKLAPQYVAAWNNLGTIFYQTRQYTRAEQAFRTALEQDPAAFEPLVNLGGVLLTLNRIDDALPFNLHAVLSRPKDALANSQLGMNYFALGKLDLAKKYLLEAKRIDPAHFSHPQMLLAEIYYRSGDRAAAAAELQSMLQLHPDVAERDKLRAMIEKLAR
jgi:tetratricopeptide (TPR) repeat protein